MLDWYPKHVEFIETMRRVPFEWGTADCGPAWVGEYVKIVTGVNPVEGRFNYKTERGAIRAMRKAGYDNLKDAATDILGKTPQHPSSGCIGDIALIKTEGPFGYAFGIVNGERVFFRREDGIGTVDLLETECIFKL